MSFTVESISFRTRWMRTRFPFKYGIAAMTELPHVFLHVKASLDGKPCEGLASEGLPPKWFTKNPETRFEEDLPEMLEAIRRPASRAQGKSAATVFEFWRKMYDAQDEWAGNKNVPPLLAHLGTALVERGVLDAFCRGAGLSFAEAVRTNALGIDLGAIHEELSGSQPAEWLPEPRDYVIARHTVGLGDPLRAGEIAPEERIGDGLPHALSDAAKTYGLTHYKIKACGNLDADIPRLKDVAEVVGKASPGFKFTLDGNEQYRDIATFREHWEAYREEDDLCEMLDGGGLLFVEQPLHREVALHEGVREELASWAEAPPMIIDESDGELHSLRQALDLGYCGTSHKNCKGVFKGIANACLIEWYRRNRPDDGPWVISGEDLANVGPVALLNDLAVMAVLGIEDVERNGHHYFAGLSMYPAELQAKVCEAHPDLYEMRPAGFPSLKIEGGRLSTRSLGAAPFGHGLELGEETLALLGDEGLPE